MATCELVEKCIFFNDQMESMPSTANVYKKLYCEGNFGDCARFIVCKAKGRDKVPVGLYPNQKERAQILLMAD